MLVSLPFLNYGGVLADSPAIERALVAEAVALAEREGVRHLELRHAEDRALGLVTRRNKVTFRLELPKDPDRLWTGFPAKLRSQIRKPEKEGLVARVGGAEELDAFYRVFAVNMRDLGTPVYPRRFFRTILERLPEAARLVVVRRGTQPLAAAFLLSFRGLLEVPWAASLRPYNTLGANMLAYWTALRHGCETEHRRFDFGRSTPDSGPARFKAQWGAEAVPLHWHYWLAPGRSLPDVSPTSPRFHRAVQLWRRLPLALANLVGPRIVRHVP
jgi:FemAB-related protein (PEP-CTERM system-associated)